MSWKNLKNSGFAKYPTDIVAIIDESNNLKSTSMALMGRLLSYFGVVYVRSYGSSITTPTFIKIYEIEMNKNKEHKVSIIQEYYLEKGSAKD